jgi:hypothetical protein
LLLELQLFVTLLRCHDIFEVVITVAVVGCLVVVADLFDFDLALALLERL